MNKAEKHAKEKGYYDNPHFPMQHVTNLMESYHQSRINEITDEEIEKEQYERELWHLPTDTSFKGGIEWYRNKLKQ